MIVDGYTPGIVVPRTQPFQYNFDLITNVLQSKQQSFDMAYLGIQKLRRDALNIQFLNKGEQEKIDNFNQKTSEFFDSLGGEYGDLSQADVQARYTSLFNEIANDTVLIDRYRKDLEIRKGAIAVEEKRNSDDPTKAGFHPVNYSNYMRRLDQYRNADLSKGDVAVTPYTDFVDTSADIAKLVRQVPIEKFTREQRLGNGQIRTVTYNGRDPEKVGKVVREYMQGKGAAQVREQAEYAYYNSILDEDDKLNLFNEYRGRIDSQISSVEQALEQVKAALPGLQGAELAQGSAKAAQLEETLQTLRTNQYSLPEFLQRDDQELIGDMTSMELVDSINGYRESYGGYARSETFRFDRGAIELMKFNADLEEKRLEQSEETSTSIQLLGRNAPGAVDMGSTAEVLNTTYQDLQRSIVNPYAGDRMFASIMEVEEPRMWRTARVSDTWADNSFLQAMELGILRAKQNGIQDQRAGIEFAKNEAQRILKEPRDAEEVAIYNNHQNQLANLASLEHFLEQANASGDQEAYIEQSDMKTAFQYGRFIVDPSQWTDKDQKDMASQYRLTYYNDLVNYTDLHAPDNATRKFRKMNYVARVEPDLIDEVEVHSDGRMTFYFSSDGFSEETDNQPAGPLVNGYMSVLEDGKYVAREIDPQSRSITIQVPERSMLNWKQNLGIFLSAEPQTRYAYGPNGPQMYQIQRDSRGVIRFNIPGVTNGWEATQAINPESAIHTIQTAIQNGTLNANG